MKMRMRVKLSAAGNLNPARSFGEFQRDFRSFN